MQPREIALLCSKYWASENLILAVAVCLGESDGDEMSHYENPSTGDDSWGLFQINMRGSMGPERRARYHLASNSDLLDPVTNVRIAHDIWQEQGHGSFSPWGAYTSGGYRKYGRYEIAQKAVFELQGGHMGWEPAACITEMLHEANALAPHRDKSSDGIIGDASHAASQSDHNPDSRGIVHAIDLTHDPRGGWDCGPRTEQIRLSKDRRVLYVIFNGRWFHGNRGEQWGHVPWAWEAYHGSSPHAEHMHVSVEYGETFENDVHPWWGEGGGLFMALTDKQQQEIYDRVKQVWSEEHNEFTDHFKKLMDKLTSIEQRLAALESKP